MKKILVPVDFSDHTNTVCRFAIEIAKTTGAEIRLFHAYFDFMLSANTTFPYTIETNEIFNQEMMVKIRNEAKEEMEKLYRKLTDELRLQKISNVKIMFTLTGGLPEEEIQNISETWAPDLIVMGTRGRGEKDILTGKVSSKVVHNATCRILTVPRDAQYHGFNNILYATDFNDEDNHDLRKLIELASNYKPVIHCIHIDIDKKPGEDQSKMDKLKSEFKQEVTEGSLVFDVIPNDDFLECVNDYVKKKNIDMIAVVHRRKSFLKRLFKVDHTRQLLFHSDIPLYIFPDK